MRSLLVLKIPFRYRISFRLPSMYLQLFIKNLKVVVPGRSAARARADMANEKRVENQFSKSEYLVQRREIMRKVAKG